MSRDPETTRTASRPPSDPGALRAGQVVAGRYRLTGALGSGGFGEVWRAEDAVSGAAVAVKLLRAGDVRVRREIAALRLLRLPGVVRLLDEGTEGERPFLVMELVPGERFPGRPQDAPERPSPPSAAFERPMGQTDDDEGPEATTWGVGSGEPERAPRADWGRVGPLVERLLTILRAVHAQGIVHRDLKPANVLVHGDDVVVLDFGIARGAAIGPTVTSRGAALGTLRYAAPEQLEGRRADARADLYALGVMAYEALVGAPPFESGEELARLVRDAPPLAPRAPGVPAAVCTILDRLLAREPRRRPRSADEVLAALGGDPVRPPLPWLGGDRTVRALVAAVEAGRAVDLGGGSGSGRSRTLAVAVAHLRAAGREVVELGPGRSALESLAPLVGPLGPDSADVGPVLRQLLRGGLVIVADDAARLDWLSRKLLDRERSAGAVIRVVDGPGDLEPEPIDEAGLTPLLHGPELVLHLPSDGARALYTRSLGVPARLAEEVDGWVAAGLAQWEAGRLRVDRAALQRIALGVLPAPALPLAAGLDAALDERLAWLQVAGGGVAPSVFEAATGLSPWEVRAELDALVELGAARVLGDGRIEARQGSEVAREWTETHRARVHGALAGVLPRGAPGRVAHLLGAGDVAELAAEAVFLAERGDGRNGEVHELLRLALAGARAEALPEEALVHACARSALADGSVPTLRTAAADLGRSEGGARLAPFLSAWALAQGGRVEEAAACVEGVADTGDERVDVYRHAVEVRALLGRGVAVAAAHVEAALGVEREGGGWDVAGDLLTRRRVEWLGQVRYLQGRFAEAAALHAAVAAAEPEAHRRTGALINAALGRRECGELETARGLAEEAVASATAARAPGLEAHARSVLRSVLYRLDAAGEPDEALCDAIACLGIATATAPACLTEAAVAWRFGEREVAVRLATRAAETWEAARTPNGAVLAWALAAAAGAPVDGEALLRRAEGLPGLVRVQVGALLGMAGLAGGREMARVECGTLRVPAPERRESVLSVNEAARIAAGGSG